MLTLPEIFTERMKKLLGNDFFAFHSEITGGVASKAFFTSTEAATDIPASLCQSPIPFCENGYYCDFDGIGKTPLHHAGGIYIQDPSAMAAISALGDKVFTNILDMCASPGGKSISAHLKATAGVLVSNEFVVSRCKTLVGNIERFSVKNAIVTCLDMTQKNELCDIYPHFFDLVICDAPCSGEGMFRKYPDEAIGEWSVENVKVCAERQKAILDNAAGFVCEGGYLLYSTCTFSLDENEMQADEFLARHPEFELIPVSESVQNATIPGYTFDGCKHQSIRHTRRFYPHISKGEGQFIALFRKAYGFAESDKQKVNYKSPLAPPSPAEMKILKEFTDKALISFDLSKVFKYNENLVYIDFDAKIPSKKVFSCGVKLGEIIKSRFEPHHQFFKCFGYLFKNKVILTDGDVRCEKYLHGEVIEANCDNGWCAVFYAKLVLGGGKAVDGVIKNHYPKGLRNI